MRNEPVVLRDYIHIQTKDIVNSTCYYIEELQDIIKDEEDSEYIEYQNENISLLNIAGARLVTQYRGIKLLSVGLIVTNLMWFANLMGWV